MLPLGQTEIFLMFWKNDVARVFSACGSRTLWPIAHEQRRSEPRGRCLGIEMEAQKGQDENVQISVERIGTEPLSPADRFAGKMVVDSVLGEFKSLVLSEYFKLPPKPAQHALQRGWSVLTPHSASAQGLDVTGSTIRAEQHSCLQDAQGTWRRVPQLCRYEPA